jgi:aromatic amino acid aminotransferase I
LNLLSIIYFFIIYFISLYLIEHITPKMAPPSAIDVDVQAIDDTTAITIPNPLTLDDVSARREATGKLIAGVAAVANVEQFKGEKHHLHKPKAKRWDRKSPI